MQSEELDKKVVEAAEHHHPAYDENAWATMEKLLDKYLPQKKDDNRRIIFFLSLFLLLGGASAIMLLNKTQLKGPAFADKQRIPEKNTSIKQTDNTNILPAVPENTISMTTQEKGPTDVKISEKQFSVRDQQTNKTTTIRKGPNPDRIISITANDPDIVANKTLSSLANNKDNKSNSATLLMPDAGNKTKNESDSKLGPGNPITENEKNLQKQSQPESFNELKKETIKKNDSSVIAKISDTKKKTQAIKRNTFFVSVSASPDVSAAGSDKAGKMKLGTGAGIGYSIRNKFTIRTGFYTGRKIYSASPDEYHPPANFWIYYPNLENVEANCKVYEIPLLVSYKFGNSSKHGWLATAGLSSYLMKEETYNYKFKDPAGQYRYNSRTIYNINKHYFSVFTLSAGYQQKINNTFFFAAEPYMKIPLTGVGYGKVKLNSAGIQLSVAAKLFNSSKRQSH